MLGCWTSGWFIMHQYPNSIWTNFAATHLQGTLPSHVVLFTTYKFRTGSLFKKMRKHINLEGVSSIFTLKSKTGILSDKDKIALDEIINQLKFKH